VTNRWKGRVIRVGGVVGSMICDGAVGRLYPRRGVAAVTFKTTVKT